MNLKPCTASRAPCISLLAPLLATTCLGLAPMAWAGSFTGVLSNSVNQNPIAGSTIEVLQERPLVGFAAVASTTTDSQGGYTIPGLPAGNYFLLVRAPGFLVRSFGSGSQTCSEPHFVFFCVQQAGTGLLLDGDVTVRRDLDTSPAARLRGRVRGSGDVALSNAYVRIGSPVIGPPPNVNPVTGEFLIDHIVPGAQTVTLGAPGWVARDPAGIESDAFGIDGPSEPITMTAGSTTELATIELRRGARLEGAPLFPSATFIRNLPQIRAFRDGEDPAGALFVGHGFDTPFSIDSLRPGSFRLLFGEPNDPVWLARWFDGASCTPTRCDPADATPVVLAAGETRSGLRVDLSSRQSISGQVRADADNASIAGIRVSASRWEQIAFLGFVLREFSSTLTDAQGRFRLDGLGANDYVLRAGRQPGQTTVPWITERWPEVRCSGIDPSCTPENQHYFTLNAEQVATTVDFTLELGGTIGGSILDPQLGNQTALPGAQVLLGTMGSPGRVQVLLQASTQWSSEPLPAGSYLAHGSATRAPPGTAIWQTYNRRNCPSDFASCAQVGADPVTIAAGAHTANVDFVLDTGDQLLVDGFE